MCTRCVSTVALEILKILKKEYYYWRYLTAKMDGIKVKLIDKYSLHETAT